MGIAGLLRKSLLRGKIKNKLLFYSISLLFINLSAITAFTFYISSSTIANEISDTNRLILQHTMENIDFVLKGIENTAIHSLTNEDLSTYIEDATGGDRSKAFKAATVINRLISGFLSIRPEAGLVYIVGSNESEGFPVIYSNAAYIKYGISNIRECVELAKSAGGRFAWVYTENNGYGLGINKGIGLSRSIIDSNGLCKGYLIIIMNEDLLSDIFSNIAKKNNEIILYNKDNIIVSSTESKKKGMRIDDYLKAGEEQKYAVDIATGKKYIVTGVFSDYTGWKLNIAEPYDDFVSPVKTIHIWVLISFLIVIIAFVFLSLILSNILTTPINRLLNKVESVDGADAILGGVSEKRKSRRALIPFPAKLDFRAKLSIMLISVIILPIIVVMVVTYKTSFDIVAAKAEELNILKTLQTKKRVEYFLKDYEKSIYDILWEQELSGILRSDGINSQADASKDTAGLTAIQRIINNIQRRSVGVLYVDVCRADGVKVYGSQNAVGGFIDTVREYADASNIWFDTYKDFSNQYVVTLGKKIIDLNDYMLIGYIFFTVRERDLETSYRSSFGNKDFAYIINRDGIIISHPDKSVLGSKTDFPGGGMPEGGYSQSRFVKKDRETYLAGTEIISNTDWFIISMTNVQSLMENMNRVFWYDLVVVMLSILVIAFLVNRVSAKISRPIKMLTRKAVSFADSGSGKEWGLSTGDEIEQLNDSFDKMMARIKRLIEEVFKAEKLKHESEIKTKEAELAMLQSQINPHFLYNTLDIIRWKAMFLTGSENEVTALVSTFSNFYRLSLGKGQKMVSIKDEIDHIKNYITLINCRYSSTVTVNWFIDSSILNYAIPKITLQPIIENAVYHGIKPKDKQGTINVLGMINKGIIQLHVEDDGVGMDEQASDRLRHSLRDIDGMPQKSGYGLRNVNQRLRLYFGDGYGLDVSSKKHVGTVISVTIPAVELDVPDTQTMPGRESLNQQS